MIKKLKFVSNFLSLLIITTLFIGCTHSKSQIVNVTHKNLKPEKEIPKIDLLKGNLTIYRAKSLSVSINDLKSEFKKLHPNVNINITSHENKEDSLKITELTPLTLAHYKAINSSAISKNPNDKVIFAKNAIVLMYTRESKYADKIKNTNWYNILLKKEVSYGYSSPNSDSCGYRSLLVFKLSENYYKKKGLYKKLKDTCTKKNILSKSTELIPLLKNSTLDYAFEYESVASNYASHDSSFKYIRLPNTINLSSIKEATFYKNAKINLNYKNSTKKITKIGEPIIYKIAMPTKDANYKIALEFLKFLFDKNKGIKLINNTSKNNIENIGINMK